MLFPPLQKELLLYDYSYIHSMFYLSILHSAWKSNNKFEFWPKIFCPKPLTNNMSWRKYLLYGYQIMRHCAFVLFSTRWNIQMFVAGCLIRNLMARGLNTDHAVIMSNYKAMKVHIQSNGNHSYPQQSMGVIVQCRNQNQGVSFLHTVRWFWNNSIQTLRWFMWTDVQISWANFAHCSSNLITT
jgi:hypothetical protein